MILNRAKSDWIVFVSTFPPRQCGIAFFTDNLTTAIDALYAPALETKIVAMNAAKDKRFAYPAKVIASIDQPDELAYARTARKLNKMKQVKVVSVQHEFGIFGGENGGYLLSFLKNLKKPAVVTLHTVLPVPTSEMRGVVREIAEHSDALVVMTASSKNILEKAYGIDPARIGVIPHGIHQVDFRESESAKTAKGFSGKLILSTHGLLGPGKGIEYAIDAMPEIVKKFPNAMFLIAGVTHPSILEHSGEEYRNELVKKVSDLGLKDRVIFYNHYLSLKDLFTLLEMTDVYVSTSLNPDQAVSGTLSYALGSGRPVVSTAFVHAQEDVTDETGILVGFKDPAAFAEAITGLLRNAEARRQMGREAYFRTRHMMYPNVALSYVNLFSRFAPCLIEAQRGLAPVNFAHLAKMTDDFGVIQFSKLAEPDVSSGYTADDNSRALAVAVRRCGKSKDPETLKLVSIYFNFLKNAARPDGNFSNYFDAERRPDADKNIKEVSEDATARSLAALACAARASSIPEKTRIEARELFEKSFGKNIVFSSPRATAIYAKALAFLFLKKKDGRILSALKLHCDRLLGWYGQSRSVDWEWFEKYLTYSNAVLPEALLAGFAATGDGRYLDAAKKTMEFLISQTWKDGVYVPIGQRGWYLQGGTRQYFDQQPEDVAAAVEALNAFYRATKDRRYRELAHWAFDWFLGRNVIGQVVCDLKTGACYDGLGDKYVNLNQGAESTISFLSARLSFD